MKKRLLALLLAVSMCMSLLPVQVFAAEAAEEEQYYEETEPTEVSEPAEAEPAESDPVATEPDEAAPETDAAEEEPAEEAADAAAEEPGEEAEEENMPSEEESAEEVLVVEEAVALNAASGTSGSLEWSLDDSGNLTITGNGAMEDFGSSNPPWYSYRADIRTVTVGEGISTVGVYAFGECSSLTGVSLPSSVTSIGICAFGGCSGLTSIVLPDDVTTIGDGAFAECSSLTGIVLPNGVKTIGDGAFAGCSSLASVTLPDGEVTIGNEAFRGCTALADTDGFVIVRGVLYDYSGSAEYLILPDSVTAIGGGAFDDELGLTTVVIPAGVTAIGENGFTGSGLHNILFEGSAPSFGDYCFNTLTVTAYYKETDTSWTEAVQGNYYGSSPTWKGYSDSGACGAGGENLTWSLNNGELAIIGSGAMEDYEFDGAPWHSVAVFIRRITIGEGITTIGSEAFNECSSMTSISIPTSVTSISEYAFAYCESLTSLVLPNGITSIGLCAFSNCGGLTSITLPSSVTSIGICAFGCCSSLTSITIPESVTTISENAFSECTALTGITIPGSVTTIERNAFDHCTGLTSIVLPDSVTTIDDWAFGYCESLTSVTVNSGTATIGSYAFFGCTKLASVFLPNGAAGIGREAFKGCTALADADGFIIVDGILFDYTGSVSIITIPTGVTSIGAGAFENKTQLTSVTIPSSVTSIGGEAFKGCTGLADADGFVVVGGVLYDYTGSATDITIPSGVTRISDRAVSDNFDLISVTLPSSVTSIGEYAFSGCSSATTITVPSGVTSIDEGAFLSCSSLASVTIPSGITEIGASVFSGCSSLTEIDIPSNITSIGDNAFSGCEGLTSVTVPGGVTSIGENAFSYCTGLTSVTIPDSVTTIGREAFKGCTGLADADGFVIVRGILFDYTGSAAEVTVPSGVTSLSAGIFFFCDYLESITLPESVTSISCSPFFMCMNLRHLYLLGSTISIEADTFEDLTATVHYSCGLKLTAAEKASCGGDCTWEVFHSGCTTVTVPATCTEGGSVTEVCACGEQENPVETLEPLGHKVENGVCTRCGCTPDLASGTCGENLTWRIDADGNLIITGSGAMRDFSNGSADWYGYRASVRSVTIEAGVTSIGNHAFEGCTAATSITVPDSVTSIGSSAFSGCSSLEGITIPSGVTTIGTHAFEGCSGLTSVAVPAGVTSIADQTFSGCSGLTSVSLPNSITTIGTWAFEGCSGLTSLSLPEGVTSIGDNAFYQCNGLKSITIPSGVKTIGSGAFKGCSGLTSVVVPDSVTSIGLAAFSGCSSLEAITIPFVGGSKKTADDSYRYPFGYIFGATNYTGGTGTWQEYQSGATDTTSAYYYIPASLKSVTVTGGNILCGAFYGCSGLTSIILPESLESIGASAFYDCDGLTSITLPESLESIGASAFYSCSGLTSVTLPDGVTSIGTKAFYDCKQVESIILPASVTSVGENAAGEKTIQIYTGNMPEEFGTQSGVVLYPENATGWENLTAATTTYAYNEENDILSGSCGTGVNYQLSTDRILRISGTGRMKNYSKTAPAPWASALKNGMVKSIVLEEGVTSVGSYAFVGNGRGYDWGYDSNLPIIKVSLTLPETIRTIGAYAFIELGVGDEQGRLTIPGSVSVIGEYAFAACGVQQLVLNSGLKSIGDFAFENCLLQEVILPDTVTTIGQWAFDGNKLTHVVVPSSVTTIDYKAFGYSNTTLKSAGPIGSGCDYEFGWTDTIPGNAFSGCSGLTGIVLPDTIRKIGIEAFKGCSAIREIKLPDSLVSIGYGAFSGCSALEELTLPAALQTLGGDWTFYGCANLTSITLPEGITEIGGEMFKNCVNLETVSIPSTVKYIQYGAFSGCTSLEQIDIPASVLHISDGAFEDCINLQRVDFNGDCPLTEEVTDDSGTTFNYGPYTTGPFANVTADVYYPYRYSSWTAAMLQNYGGELTWIKKEVATSLTLQYSSAMVAGESQKLTYAFKPQGISGATVTWSLGEEDGSYASISSDGTLTAKAVTEIRTVTVTVTPSVETVQPVSVKVKIYPQVEAKLYANGVEVSGTYYLDTEVTDSVEFTAEITPEGVCPGYQLSCNDWEGQYCTYTQTASGSLLLTPNSPQTNGTVEVYLLLNEPYNTAKDVAVRIVHYENELKLDNAPALSAGGSMTLTASLLSKNSGEALTNQPIVWTLVDGSAFATLSAKGVLKAKAVTETQTVTIRAESKNDAAAPVEFTVTILPRATIVRIADENGAAVTGKTLTRNLREEALETMTFSADTLPADAGKDVVWSCSDKKLAICIWNTDEDGNLIVEPAQTGKTGTVTFTATAADGSKKKATVKVSFVKAALPGELEFTVAPDTLKGKQTIALKTNIDALAAAEGLSAKKLTWSLGEGSEFFAAITSSGKLTVKPVGKEETIKVLAAVAGYPEIYAEKTITLQPAESGRTDEIRLFHEDKLVNNGIVVLDTLQGTELQLEAVAYPEGAGIVWKSSSSKIAAVDENGKVTALKAGTVVITATADDGSKVAASVKVTVRASVTGLSFTTPAGTVVTGGKKLSLSYAFAGEVKPTNTKVSFALAEQDAPYATISKAGVVSAAKVTGSHRITVTITSDEDPAFRDTLELLVQPAASAVEIRNAWGGLLTGTYSVSAQSLSRQLKAVTYPKDAADAVSWKSSAPAVAAVDENGKVTFTGKTGKVKITATATDGSGKSASVTYIVK